MRDLLRLVGPPEVRPIFPARGEGLLCVRVRAVGFGAAELPELAREVAAQLRDRTELDTAGMLLSNGTACRYVARALEPHEEAPARRLRRVLFDRAGTPAHLLGARVALLDRELCGASVVAWSGRLAVPPAGTLRLKIYDAHGVLRLDCRSPIGARVERKPRPPLPPDDGSGEQLPMEPIRDHLRLVGGWAGPRRDEWRPRWCVVRLRLRGASARSFRYLFPRLRRKLSAALGVRCTAVAGIADDGIRGFCWPQRGELLRRLLVGPGRRRPAFELAQALWEEQLAPALAAVTMIAPSGREAGRWICKLYDGTGRRLQVATGRDWYPPGRRLRLV